MNKPLFEQNENQIQEHSLSRDMGHKNFFMKLTLSVVKGCHLISLIMLNHVFVH